jgi:hypothetical protein
MGTASEPRQPADEKSIKLTDPMNMRLACKRMFGL